MTRRKTLRGLHSSQSDIARPTTEQNVPSLETTIDEDEAATDRLESSLQSRANELDEEFKYSTGQILLRPRREKQYAKKMHESRNLPWSSESYMIQVPRSLSITLTLVYLSLSAILLISSVKNLAQADPQRESSLIRPYDGFSSFLFSDTSKKQLKNIPESKISIDDRSSMRTHKVKRHNTNPYSSDPTYRSTFSSQLSKGLREGLNELNSQSGSLLVCPEGWQQHSTQCYRFFQQRRSWSRARETCERFGAQLALVLDYQQNNFTGYLASVQLAGFGPNPMMSNDQASKYHQQIRHQPKSQVYASDERSYWIGFKTIDRLETNTLESSANTFVSKYLGFWDYDEPRVSQGECVKATVRHETITTSGDSSSAYKLGPQSSTLTTGK